MMIEQQLNVLQDSGLVSLVQHSEELEYIFRHALVQEAAYASLLKQDRKRLHLAVGEAMERNFGGQINQLAPILAQHFADAGENAKALKYYMLAGDQALQQYAIPEAITHYDHAIELAQSIADSPQLVTLLRSRAVACEAAGEFDRARADHELALSLARTMHDDHFQWQELLNLGMLWAGKDYLRTGAYYQQAYQLAQQIEDAQCMAHTLNHLGNWLVNVERTAEAVDYHRQALGIFERLHDVQGTANSEDFLSMATALSGDMRSATRHSQRAIALYRQLNDRRGLANVMASSALRSANYQTSIVETMATLFETVQEGNAAVELARQIGWRSIETFALNTLALTLASMGEYTQALDCCRQGLELARNISHRQWQTFAFFTLGAIHLDTFAYPLARASLEQASTLASEINSAYWVRTCGSYLAATLIALDDLAAAKAVLDPLFEAESPTLTLSLRLAWYTRATLTLAAGQPGETLRIIDWLNHQNPHNHDSKRNLRLTHLRGDTFMALGQYEQALPDLHAALEVATNQGVRPAQWRILASLQRALLALGRPDEAQEANAALQAILHELITRLPLDQRDEYLRQTNRLCNISHR